MENLRLFLIIFAGLTSALTAGIFFTFSTFVMQALGEQTPTSGISTMQSINITVINPWFMTAFFAPVVACLILVVSFLPQWQETNTIYLVIGGLCYLIGTIGVTVVGNIPLNDALAVVTPNTTEATMLWSKYLKDWTFWNHVRTIAAFVASILFIRFLNI